MSLALPGLPKVVVAGYDKTQEHVSLSFQRSHDLLVSLLDIFPRTTIIIDALDESDPLKRSSLLQVLNTIVQYSANVVKIFVSSRDDVDIQLRLDKVPNLYIEAQDNAEDIKRFINREMADWVKNKRLASLPVEMKDKIMATLADKANGMYVFGCSLSCFSGLTLPRFQWVNLQIQYLNAMRFDEDIMDSLGKLPRSLKATYSQILASMREGTNREWVITERALMWMICSQIPLTQQLWAELTYWPNPVPAAGITTLFELCHHLVTSNGQSKYVTFAHLSVREYLETEFTPEASNSMAAECCLSILDSTALPVVLYTRDDYGTLGRYGSRYWPDHVDRSYQRMEHISRPLLDHLRRFLGSATVPGQSYRRWMCTLSKPNADNMSWPYGYVHYLVATPPNPLFVACNYRFGEELHDMFVWDDIDINSTNDMRQTLLHVAIATGRDGIVKILLDAGADHHSITGDYLETPLAIAFKLDNRGIVAQLLHHGATHGWYTNIISAAMSCGARMSVMTWLIDREPIMKITESVLTGIHWYRVADDKPTCMLIAKARNMEIDWVLASRHIIHFRELLLDSDPRIKISEAGLIAWVRFGSEALISVLLSRKAPIKITEAVVAAAVSRGGTETLTMLLATDPNIKVTEAVLAAAGANTYYGERMVRVLLASGSNFEITLSAVMKLGPAFGRDTVCLLLFRVQNTGITERRLLDYVQNNSSREMMVEILLARDPTIRITEDLLLAAAQRTDCSMMATLLASNTNISITETIVNAAVSNNRCGHKLMSMLRKKDSKIEITVELLTAAAMNAGCGEGLMETLLDTGTIRKAIVSDEEYNSGSNDAANPGNEYEDHRRGRDGGGGEFGLRAPRDGGTSCQSLEYQTHQGRRGVGGF